MSEISNEIWSITASHTFQQSAPIGCVSGHFFKCVVIFILRHWGVRWKEAARQEWGGGMEGIHLNLLAFHCPVFVFFLFLLVSLAAVTDSCVL